jgi:hypothetical protein
MLKMYGQLNFVLLAKDGLINLRKDKNGKCIPITSYVKNNELRHGQLNDKDELHGIGRKIYC